MGTGMTDNEVVEFSARVNTVALRAYSGAVGRRTQEIVRGQTAEAWDDVPDAVAYPSGPGRGGAHWATYRLG